MQITTGFSPAPDQHLQQLRDERDEVVALLQEVRVAVLAFHNRAGILLVNSASSFKASCVSPLLPPTSVQQPWTRRREKLRTRPRRPRTHRRATRRRRRRRARPPRRRRRRARRPRAAGADDQPSGRRTFPSVQIRRETPGCALARHETAAKLQARARDYSRVARGGPSVPGNDKPTGLGHAGLDAGGARLRRARLGLIWEGRPPELPGADAVCRISELWDDGVVTRERRRVWMEAPELSPQYSNAGGHHAPRGNQK